MKYCKKCVQPDTRPGIYFSDEGVCGACLYEEDVKKNIDWDQRVNELKELVEWAKREAEGKGTNYDCAIGVSGGKDSTFQALYARDKLGLRPLLVNSEPEGITEIGARNIENLKNLGFDVISLRPNPVLMKKLIKRDFYRHANPAKITEYSLYSSTYIIADKFSIPLIIQGENPGLTLGARNTGVGVDGDALKANMLITLASGIKEYLEDGFDEKDLYMFHYVADSLRRKGVRGSWLNYYEKNWSPTRNAALSIAHGLTIRPPDVNLHDLGTYRRYSQMDGRLLEVNQLLKYLKFGFGQATDYACYDIRDRLITREQGIVLVKEFDGRCGEQYIQHFCNYIDITIDEFWRVANSVRGDMWDEDRDGNWMLKNPIWEQEPVGDININEVIASLDRSLNRVIMKYKKGFETLKSSLGTVKNLKK